MRDVEAERERIVPQLRELDAAPRPGASNLAPVARQSVDLRAKAKSDDRWYEFRGAGKLDKFLTNVN
jgi:hypothetical protein